MQLASYIPKTNKVVIMLSTPHTSTEVSEEMHRKPFSILQYNNTKFGINTGDQLAHACTSRRKSLRWPITMFSHLLDLATINASILFLFNKPHWEGDHSGSKRRQFLLKMSLEMMKTAMEHRII
nr:uncharacterized protein LOC124817833 [Hydra vulgaris]